MNTDQKQNASKGLKNAIKPMGVVRRVDWQKETPHPRLNILLQELAAAGEKSTVSAPVVEIAGHPGGRFVLMPGALADFAIRLFAAWRERKPPFDQASVDAILQKVADAPDNVELLVRILFGDVMPALDRMAPEEMRRLLECGDRKTSWTSLTAGEMASVIRANGGDATEKQILNMIDDGAPVNPDGSLNYFSFVAWLEKRACKE